MQADMWSATNRRSRQNAANRDWTLNRFFVVLCARCVPRNFCARARRIAVGSTDTARDERWASRSGNVANDDCSGCWSWDAAKGVAVPTVHALTEPSAAVVASEPTRTARRVLDGELIRCVVPVVITVRRVLDGELIRCVVPVVITVRMCADPHCRTSVRANRLLVDASDEG
jgi:hypothetical protein